MDTWPFQADLTPEGVRDNWRRRNIVYFIGLDNNADINNLQKECLARAQGRFRLQRTRNIFQHIREFYPPVDGAVHELSEVPGISHDHNGVYRSKAGRRDILDS